MASGEKQAKKRCLVLGGHRIPVESGSTIMEGLSATGVLLRSDCGGQGRCGKCLVRVRALRKGPGVSSPDEQELRISGQDRPARGWRLACRTRVDEDISIEVPESSLLDPEVVLKDVDRAFSLFRASSSPGQAPSSPFGIAVDLGTTTMTIYLCDIEKRALAASASFRNPQALFGEDVVSRISAIQRDQRVLHRLQKMATRAVDLAVSRLCAPTRVKPQAIGSAVLVGNSIMLHLILGVDPTPMGLFPYTPAFVESRSLYAGDIGLEFHPEARINTLPLISGFVGADLVSAALAMDFDHMPAGTLLADVGTNGELALVSKKGLAVTSCATGPALEGAGIRWGMPAGTGAIDRVRFNRDTGRMAYTMVRHGWHKLEKPVGICGSGVLSVVAELLRHGFVLDSGRFNRQCSFKGLRMHDDRPPEFEIVPGDAAQSGEAITFSQTDVRAVQLAKGALRAGIELLCLECGIEKPGKMFLAGAFGSSLDKADAIRVGLLPPMNRRDIEVVGNAAGAGAITALFDKDALERARHISRAAKVVDLSKHPAFQKTFIRALSF